ncbi:hypothetical protein [Noviherbaspirillum soli]|uniref:hypothetical protein n=1 Tax=Noviherbaspirillum soli TaxID=1064518 RepID=UPI00188A0FA3|nr:hypothetical protein [Noviherbaspirillum soli]
MRTAEKLYFKSVPSIAAAPENASSGDMPALTLPEDISSFVDNATRPIRTRQSRCRPDMICLYQVGRFEYLLEKLGFFLYDIQQRRRDAHIAVETFVRPLLDEGNPSRNAAQISKLHERVKQKKFTASARSQRSTMHASARTRQPQSAPEFAKTRTVGGAVLVPDGVSILWAKSSDVIAEAKIVRTLGTGSDKHDKLVRSVETEQLGLLQNPPGDGEINLVDYYEKCLGQVQNSTVVLELVADEKRHWDAAYSAAINIRRKSQSKKSIMLLPPLESFEQALHKGGKQGLSPLNRLQFILDGLNQQGSNKPLKTRDQYVRSLDEDLA